MNTTQLEKFLTRLGPFGQSELYQRSRCLREAGMLPNSGRGRSAPDLSVTDAGNILLGLAASPRADLAAATVQLYRKLKPADGDFAGCKTLGEAVDLLLGEPDTSYAVEALTVVRSWPLAIISLKDGRTFPFGYRDHASAARDGFETYGIREEVRFDIGVLSQIGAELEVKDEGGWTGSGGMKAKLEEIAAAQKRTRK